MNSVREAVEKIRALASNWLTDHETDGATAMGEITATLLNTSFEEPQVITIDPTLTEQQLDGFRKRFEAAQGQTLHACNALIDIHASEWRTDASRDVLIERRRQVEAEGLGLSRDDQYTKGELADAAGSYALSAHDDQKSGFVPAWWPWDMASFKRSNPRRDLVKAGALILAEIERLDRAELSKSLADAAMLQAGFGPVEELPHGLTWDAAPADAVALIEGVGGDDLVKMRLLVWVKEIDAVTVGELAIDFDHKKAGSSARVQMTGDHNWQVIALRPLKPDDGWIEWDPHAGNVVPEGVAFARRRDGEVILGSCVNSWDASLADDAHREIVAYRLTAPDTPTS